MTHIDLDWTIKFTYYPAYQISFKVNNCVQAYFRNYVWNYVLEPIWDSITVHVSDSALNSIENSTWMGHEIS